MAIDVEVLETIYHGASIGVLLSQTPGDIIYHLSSFEGLVINN